MTVLESRLRNLQLLADKRNEVGVAQARLAIEVVERFISALIREKRWPQVRKLVVEAHRKYARRKAKVRPAAG